MRDIDKRVEPKAKAKKEPVGEYVELRKHLSEFFKTDIGFSRDDKGKGKIVIPFRSDDELEQIVSILDRAKS